MLYTTLHNRILRLVLAVLGELIAAAALNLFIVPLSLYTGGLLGFCQLVRTLLQDFLGVSFGAYDIAGVLYFLLNIPLLMIGYRNLGRGLAVRTIICTVSYSVFYSIIPIPTQPIVDDYLTACLLGGILTGIGSGIVLTCGGSGGGLDVLGLIMSKRDSAFTVGKFALGFNALLYTAILILFDPEVAIYSVIYNFANSMILDRMHPAECYRSGSDFHAGGRERPGGLHYQTAGAERDLLGRRGRLHQGRCPCVVRVPLQI